MTKKLLILLFLVCCLPMGEKVNAQTTSSYTIYLEKDNSVGNKTEDSDKKDEDHKGDHQGKHAPAKPIFIPSVYYNPDEATLQFVGQSPLEAVVATITDQAGTTTWTTILSIKRAEILTLILPIIPQQGDRLKLTIGSDDYVGEF